MKTGREILFCTIVLLTILIVPCYGETSLTILHPFAGGPMDGYGPIGRLALSGSTLYGTVGLGGEGGGGTIFSMNTDGSNYKVLYSFGQSANDGAIPVGDLILQDSTLYGMTYSGGIGTCYISGCGTVFSMNTDGSNYKVLHFFGGDDGGAPLGSLTLYGSTLYGTTSIQGTIFSIDTDGNDHKVLHVFGGGANGGADPTGGLILSGSTLYGTAASGGRWDHGIVFSINTDGSHFKILHSFNGGANGGSYPLGSLALSGSTLYGTTMWGGGTGCLDGYGCGTIFSMNRDGRNFKTLHSFTGGAEDGAHPNGSLALSGSTLYGTTGWGGGTGCLAGDGCGTIFSIDTDGRYYVPLYSFGPNTNDGANPHGGLSLSGLTLYGTTLNGGTSCYDRDDGCGTIFSYDLPPSSLFALDVAKSGTGAGAVTSSTGGISCGTTCSAPFITGTVVTLTATPDRGSIFAGWSGGGCRRTGTCTVTMKGNVNVVAAFAREQFSVRASVSGGRGRVSPAFRKVSYGDSAWIGTTPARGYYTASITDNGVSMPVSNPYVINDITASHNVVVVFAPSK